jgi:hypothetical protein
MKMNAFTARKSAEGRALYVAMCKGKIAQRGIHKVKNGKAVKPIIGGGYAYHGHINID